MSDRDPGTPDRGRREAEGEAQRRPSASAGPSNATSPSMHPRDSPVMAPRTNSSGDTPQRVGLNLGLGRPRGPSADFVSNYGRIVWSRMVVQRNREWPDPEAQPCSTDQERRAEGRSALITLDSLRLSIRCDRRSRTRRHTRTPPQSSSSVGMRERLDRKTGATPTAPRRWPRYDPHAMGMHADTSPQRIYSNSNTPTSPNPPAMPIPPRRSSVSSTDDGYDSDSGATPRTTNYFPHASGGQRPNIDGRRSSDAAAQTQPVPSSPHHSASQQGSTHHGRRSRISLAPAGSSHPGISRSGSRARLPAHAMTKGDQEDDEVVVIDRGEDLIRRRLKERKRAKRERERRLAAEAEAAEEDEEQQQASAMPSTTTAATESSVPYSAASLSLPQRSQATSPVRGHRSVSVSRARASSSARHQGTRVPSRSGSISSDGGGPDRPASSLAPGRDDGDMEEDGDHEEDEDDEVRPDSGDDEDDEDGSGGDDEGVTVKDRQDVSSYFVRRVS